MNIGTAIARMRNKCAYTQVGLARAAGVTKHYLSHVECGRVEPSVALLRRLASAMKVDMLELLHGGRRYVEFGKVLDVPSEAGVYACRVEHPHDTDLLTDRFLSWTAQGWFHVGSDQRHRGDVYAWVGPLPRTRKEQ